MPQGRASPSQALGIRGPSRGSREEQPVASRTGGDGGSYWRASHKTQLLLEFELGVGKKKREEKKEKGGRERRESPLKGEEK